MLRSFLRAARPHTTMRRSGPRRPLVLEHLEDRTLPAVTWSAGIALPGVRSGDAAIMATDHSILVFGGGTTVVNQLAIGATAWKTANAIDVARVSPAVVSIGGNELLVYGGTAGGSALNTALAYDPSNSNNIHSVASMSTPRSLLAYAADGSNRAYAIGGIDGSGNRLATVERFDPATGSWSMAAPLPQAISGAVAVYDGAGHIFVLGGATSSSSRTSTALKYTVATNTWATVHVMSTSATEAAAVLGPDGLIYVLGGKGSEGTQGTVQAYNPTTNTWSKATSLPNGGVSDEAAVVDAQNRIEVLGGSAYGDNFYAVSSANVTQTLANYAPLFTTAATALPSATAGVAYTATVAALGSPAPTFSLVSGPTGLSVSSAGVITWTPVAAQIGNATVTVQAQNVAGSVQQTFTLTITPDITPPTIPVLSVGSITTSSIALAWTAATDNVGVAGYRLYKYTPAYTTGHSGRGGGYTYHPATYAPLVDGISPATTSYTFTGLSSFTTYNYAVAAYDAAGNQSGYSTASGTTWQAPSITYYQGSIIDPALSVVANHQLYFTLYGGGNPAPTLSLVSAPSGVVFSPGVITWTPTASQLGANDILVQATNSAGTVTLDIPVTVTADVPVPSLTVNGGLAYGLGNVTSVSGTPPDYQMTLNEGFDISGGTHPQHGLVGTPFSFQFTGVSNTNPTSYALVSGPSTMTLDPNTGIGTWAPSESDVSAATSVTVSATNSAGTILLTFTFPTYFTTAPGNVAVGFLDNTSGSAPATWTPVVSWTAPANSAYVADFTVTVTDRNTGIVTVYDTQSTATSYNLAAGMPDDYGITVTAYDALGNASPVSPNPATLYLASLANLNWTFSTATAVAGQAMSVQFSYPYTRSYAIVSGPAGVSINPTTGLLSWTPTLSDVGTANIVVSATGNNGWGTMSVYATLNFPVYFTDAPTGVSVSSSTDPVSNITTWTAFWNAPTMNTSSIAGYQISFVPAGATQPIIFTVPATSLSVVLPDLAALGGSVQVVAFDAAGDFGVPSLVFTF